MENSKADYEIYNVGGGMAYTVLELADMIGKVFGNEVRPKTSGEFRLGDTRHSVSDISKIRGLGWKPVNSIEKSVADYVAWLKEEGAIQDLVEYSQKRMKDQGVVRKARADLKEII